MSKISAIARVSVNYLRMKKEHKSRIADKLGFNITETELDNLYVRKLKNMNALEELFKP